MTIRNRLTLLIAEKAFQEHRHISVAEVSRAIGVSDKTLGFWARNEVTRYDAPIIEGLCRYFDCNIGDLLEFIP